jgi:hypothetical protein
MKVMCVYEGWWPDPHPVMGDICHVSRIHYGIDGRATAYDLQEFPLPHPFRWGAWFVGPGKRLCKTFIEVEDDSFADEIIERLIKPKKLTPKPTT